MRAGRPSGVWAKVALGRYFTYTVMTSSDQPVITSGPYRYVRHPSYTGILLIAIGAGAVWGNWLGLGALTLGDARRLGLRIYVEEKALLEELGDRYRSYAEDHKRLRPLRLVGQGPVSMEATRQPSDDQRSEPCPFHGHRRPAVSSG